MPAHPVGAWIRFARLAKGPVFRRVTGRGKDVGPDRLKDQEVARLVKKTALAAGGRGDLWEAERGGKFAGIRCVPALPPPPRSTNAMCRSSSATLLPG